MLKFTLMGAAATISVLTQSAAIAAQPSSDSLNQKVTKLSAETAALQQEIRTLKTELRSNARVRYEKPKTLESAAAGQSSDQEQHLSSDFLRYINGVTVTTSPILGLRSKYDASDLVTNLPSMNEDLRLLQQRAYLERLATEKGYHYLEKPALILSGRVEGVVVDGGNFNGQGSSDIDLSGVGLDIEPIVSEYAAGFISLLYDDSPPVLGFRERTSNSRIFLRRGFLTIGNLNKAPVYFTMGQLYVPFGRYSSAMVTAPMTLTIARTLTRAAVLGYSQDGVYAQGYAYDGDSHTNNGGYINEGGANLGVTKTYSRGDYDVGMGYISNMADSSGMQETGNTADNTFQGFGQNDTTEQLQHRVPGLDFHGSLDFGNFTFLAEYVGALRHFSPMDLTFNSQGAAPKAAHTEVIYNFPLCNKPSNVGVTYGESWQSLGLNVPQNSYSVAFNTSLWKDTLEAIEFRHDVNYSQTDSAVSATATTPVSLGTHSTRNTVTAQIGVYF